MKRAVLTCLALAVLWLLVSIDAHCARSVQVTVYNQNFGVVKEQRELNLSKGFNVFRFEDVAKFIDATSVKFKSITDPDGTSVIE